MWIIVSILFLSIKRCGSCKVQFQHNHFWFYRILFRGAVELSHLTNPPKKAISSLLNYYSVAFLKVPHYLLLLLLVARVEPSGGIAFYQLLCGKGSTLSTLWHFFQSSWMDLRTDLNVVSSINNSFDCVVRVRAKISVPQFVALVRVNQ